MIPKEECKNGYEKFDILGADVYYSKEKRTFRMSMEGYVRKLLEKFDMKDCNPVATPSFPEERLYKESKPSPEFNYRGCVGALQWLVVCCRPDIAHITNVLARASSRTTASYGEVL